MKIDGAATKLMPPSRRCAQAKRSISIPKFSAYQTLERSNVSMGCGAADRVSRRGSPPSPRWEVTSTKSSAPTAHWQPITQSRLSTAKSRRLCVLLLR
jgi:hypothetical protein